MRTHSEIDPRTNRESGLRTRPELLGTASARHHVLTLVAKTTSSAQARNDMLDAGPVEAPVAPETLNRRHRDRRCGRHRFRADRPCRRQRTCR